MKGLGVGYSRIGLVLVAVGLSAFPARALVTGFVEIRPDLFVGVGLSVPIEVSGVGIRLAVNPAPRRAGVDSTAVPDDEPFPAVVLRAALDSPGVLTSENELVTRLNFFVGNRPERWMTDRRVFGCVHVRWGAGHHLLLSTLGSQILVRPAPEFRRLLTEIASEHAVSVCDAGSGFLVRTKNGGVKARAYGDGYLVGRAEEPPTDATATNVRDETVWWSTYLGGPWNDNPHALASSPDGGLLICGETDGAGFPITPGSFDTTWSHGYDGVIAKMDASGMYLLWATYIGGYYTERIVQVQSLPNGDVAAVGWSGSHDFPTTPGSYDRTWNGSSDGVVLVLSGSGDHLVWSTFLGGAETDYLMGCAVQEQGDLIVIGATESPDFPVTPGTWDQTYNGESDGVIVRITSNGQAVRWGTYLGGARRDFDILPKIVNLSSEILVAADWTFSPDFPVTAGVFGSVFHGPAGCSDAAIAALRANDGQLVWSGLLGGADGCEYFSDPVITPSGNIALSGWTGSADLPTTPGAFDRSYNGGGDGFAAEVTADGTALLWSTFLGGVQPDGCAAIRNIWTDGLAIVGAAASPDFPTTADGFRPSLAGAVDAVALVLTGDGTEMRYGTFFGGQGDEHAIDLEIRGDEFISLLWTFSSDLPMGSTGFDPVYNGRQDMALFSQQLSSTTAVPPDGALKGRLMIVPNPTAGIIRVRVPSSTGRVEVEAFDPQGRLAGRAQGTGSSGWIDLALGDGACAARGVYLVRLRAGSRSFAGKVSVVR